MSIGIKYFLSYLMCRVLYSFRKTNEIMHRQIRLLYLAEVWSFVFSHILRNGTEEIANEYLNMKRVTYLTEIMIM